MRRHSRTAALGIPTLIFAATALPAQAGMTVIVFSDLAAARLEVISFFAVGYLLLAWAVKGLWNALRKTFASLPRLTYRNSLALMLVSGLLMYVVLTMISGARELMTPGAWEKQGISYSLRDEPTDSPKDERRRAMERLKSQLWDFAAEHDGRFPKSLFDPEFPRRNWVHPGTRAYYCYLPTAPAQSSRSILVYEPANVGARRYVLLSDGAIEQWKESELKDRLLR